jgi:hypothetical protein
MNAWSEITVVTSLHSRLDKFENLIFCQNVKIYLAIFGFLIKFDGLEITDQLCNIATFNFNPSD